MNRRILVLAALALTVAMVMGGLPAVAQPTTQSIGEDGADDAQPSTVESPAFAGSGTPVTQSGSTATDATDSDAAGDVALGCKTTTLGYGSYSLERKVCVMTRDKAGTGTGTWFRTKARFTFWFNGPTGRSTAYGNVRWDVKWGGNMFRRYYAQNVVKAYTANRPDAIQVHTTVGYSKWGCGVPVHITGAGWVNNHFVRMPNGDLWGPHDLVAGNTVIACYN